MGNSNIILKTDFYFESVSDDLNSNWSTHLKQLPGIHNLSFIMNIGDTIDFIVYFDLLEFGVIEGIRSNNIADDFHKDFNTFLFKVVNKIIYPSTPENGIDYASVEFHLLPIKKV